jgi:DnaJ-class molecular chaperone
MKLSKAYETLSDPEKRRFYDQTGFADKDAQQEVFAISPPHTLSCACASVAMLFEHARTHSLTHSLSHSLTLLLTHSEMEEETEQCERSCER